MVNKILEKKPEKTSCRWIMLKGQVICILELSFFKNPRLCPLLNLDVLKSRKDDVESDSTLIRKMAVRVLIS